ncbi:hypothetical protein GLOTRDRAFT_131511 [Gloeophyllum trabeum ATCC 11539]|uniref:Uncharacterized protein n=1 Tax=Gloeophyllum trabeum (strain ATCC 11539 / FP-39264 / Madison 617) TaxID=670483 RepID=S7PZX7_GLOTA|nr:uncharacterized protein GLOTRDRAFT_131511 [Gloeophyllum trabeum ATCC 11539]EPQ53236.1 hypothetical protein GLOTRDRAFT_131511 [Gloeophyllum trabeum ATCC 11539]
MPSFKKVFKRLQAKLRPSKPTVETPKPMAISYISKDTPSQMGSTRDDPIIIIEEVVLAPSRSSTAVPSPTPSPMPEDSPAPFIVELAAQGLTFSGAKRVPERPAIPLAFKPRRWSPKHYERKPEVKALPEPEIETKTIRSMKLVPERKASNIPLEGSKEVASANTDALVESATMEKKEQFENLNLSCDDKNPARQVIMLISHVVKMQAEARASRGKVKEQAATVEAQAKEIEAQAKEIEGLRLQFRAAGAVCARKSEEIEGMEREIRELKARLEVVA